MSSRPCLYGTMRIVIGCILVLGITARAGADPKPLTKEEQAKVDKAIEKGVAYLKRIQRKKGDWPLFMSGYPLGQTLLPAYALLESGVPANDPVIQKAADYVRPRVLKVDRTYEVSLAVLFLDRLGDPKDKPLIRRLGLRLIAAQHLTGGWNYRCPALSKQQEEGLSKALEEFTKGLETKEKSRGELVDSLELPRSLRALAVFRDPSKLPWRDPPSSERNMKYAEVAGYTDNSNTQFAMLGLWAAQRQGAPAGPTFQLMVERFERSQVANGWWPYSIDADGLRLALEEKRFPSMLCVGLLGLAIGRGLKLPTPGVPERPAEDLRVLKGLAALSQDIGVAGGRLDHPLTKRQGYYLWSVERVAMLYDLPMIGDKDWYKWGAGILVSAQEPGGEWNNVLSDYWVRNGYRQPVVETSFALLFLKHSHPMKELTPKLPLKGKKLNQGITRLLNRDAPLERSTTIPSRSDPPKP